MLLECEHCVALVDAEIVASYVLSATENGPDFKVSFVKCPKCSSPLLALQDEDLPDGWGTPQRLYPNSSDPLGSGVPKPIQAAFGEATRCLRAKAFTAAAIMCRKTLEGLCDSHGIRGVSLAKGLELLRDAGTIDRRLFEWAEQLRLFGNEAAHDVNVVISAPDAADIIEFTRAIVEYVFTFQERFEDFKKRHAAAAVG